MPDYFEAILNLYVQHVHPWTPILGFAGLMALMGGLGMLRRYGTLLSGNRLAEAEIVEEHRSSSSVLLPLRYRTLEGEEVDTSCRVRYSYLKEIGKGETIRVYYLPNRPKICYPATEMEKLAASARNGVLVGLAFLGLCVILGVFFT